MRGEYVVVCAMHEVDDQNVRIALWTVGLEGHSTERAHESQAKQRREGEKDEQTRQEQKQQQPSQQQLLSALTPTTPYGGPISLSAAVISFAHGVSNV